MRQFTCPKAVTHPSTNRARCRATALNETNALPLHQTAIVHAFVACRLDYCNSLLHGITDSPFRQLQSIQNAATRLITGTQRRDHITPVLRDLHWLPIRCRVNYKQALLVYKSLHRLLTIASWLPLTSFATVCVRPTWIHASSRYPYPLW